MDVSQVPVMEDLGVGTVSLLILESQLKTYG